MFRFAEGLKVHLHRDPVDFRMGGGGRTSRSAC